MKKKKAFIVWCIVLCGVVLTMLGLLIAKGMGASVPDAVIRILGTVAAISGPVILIVGARMYNEEKKEKTEE